MANVSSSNGLEKRPKLRFPGFDEPWKETNLSTLFSKSTQKNADGHITNVICNSAKLGLIPQREYFDKDIANSDNTSGYYIIRQNDFVYNPRKSSDAPYGPISSYKYAEDGIVSPLYLCFHAKGEINPLYYEWYFRSSAWHRYIYMSGDSGARHDRVSIKDDTFFAMPINLPSEQEQSKIASFLQSLDERIAAQEKLVASLKKYKRGVVRTLLSPKRCSIKNVKWTTSRIGDIGTFIKGAPLSKADISLEGTPFILYGELYTTYSEVISNVVRKTQASADKQYYSQIGDVIIPTSGETPEEISTASCVMLPDIILAGDLNIYRCTQVDGRIMSYILNHVVNDRIARIAQGKSVVHVQAAEISKIEITYPDPFSQKTIIAILAAISDRIDQSNAELRLLHELRKALLQKLFI
jgi:type I restriction enzyme S subunit